MQCEQTKDIRVLQISCSNDSRHLPPTRKAIDDMKKALKENGQINPIGVHPITRNTYRVISGATRFRAASELNWKTIRASVWSGSAVDFQIHELAENLDRRELTGPQRREMKAKIKELQRQQLADVKPSKGGRGKKGGLREAARQAGMAQSTARDRQNESKVSGNEGSRSVSDAPKSLPFAPMKLSVMMPTSLIHRLDKWCSAQNLSRTDGAKRIIRERLDADHIKETVVPISKVS